MAERVRIADIAEELGLSTATVSNVIHGKTKKISDETVRRVQELLEERQYIPSMAGILLAQNDSRIIGVVVNNHEKYEGHALEDGFISSSLSALETEIQRSGCFMMVKVTDRWEEITRFASMWNMNGLVLIGFCDSDYGKLRENMHIPFVVYDGYLCGAKRISNITVDNRDGGLQMGNYLKSMGHRRVLCISDNDVCVDLERYQGLCAAFPGEEPRLMIVPMVRGERHRFYEETLAEIRSYTAIFAVSDAHAIELIFFLQEHGIRVPEDISVAGFDDSPAAAWFGKGLTTVRQDAAARAGLAMRLLSELKEQKEEGQTCVLPVALVERGSVGAVSKRRSGTRV